MYLRCLRQRQSHLSRPQSSKRNHVLCFPSVPNSLVPAGNCSCTVRACFSTNPVPTVPDQATPKLTSNPCQPHVLPPGKSLPFPFPFSLLPFPPLPFHFHISLLSFPSPLDQNICCFPPVAPFRLLQRHCSSRYFLLLRAFTVHDTPLDTSRSTSPLPPLLLPSTVTSSSNSIPTESN